MKITKNILLSFMLALLLSNAVFGQSSGNTITEKERVLREVGSYWIEIGQEQFDRGLYEQAMHSFGKASENTLFMEEAQRKLIEQMQQKSKIAARQRGDIPAKIAKAEQLIKQGKLVQAEQALSEIEKNEFMTDQEQKFVTANLGDIRAVLRQRERQIQTVYNRSIQLYEQGELEKARDGFIEILRADHVPAEVAGTVEGYLLEIDMELAGQAALRLGLVQAEPRQVAAEKPAKQEETPKTEPKQQQGDPQKIQLSQRDILLGSYARARINENLSVAARYLARNEPERARNSVERARMTLLDNKEYFDHAGLQEITGQIDKMSSQISSERRN